MQYTSAHRRTAQGADDIDIGRHAGVGVASASARELRQVRELCFQQVRQRQIIKKTIEEFFARKNKTKIVLAAAFVCGRTARGAGPAIRPRQAITGDELAIAGVYRLAPPARSEFELRFGDRFARQLDPLATLKVFDRAPVDRVGDGFLDLRFVAANKPRAVDCALIAAV